MKLAKNLKLKIKNTQLAKAAGLDKLKEKLGKKPPKKMPPPVQNPLPEKTEGEPVSEEQPERRIRAKSKSSFVEKKEDYRGDKRSDRPLSSQVGSEQDATAVSTEASEQSLSSDKETQRLGPTGRHVKDLLRKATQQKETAMREAKTKKETEKKFQRPITPSPAPEAEKAASKEEEDRNKPLLRKGKKVRDFKDIKPAKTSSRERGFDARDRAGLREGEDERWRKRRGAKSQTTLEEDIVRPTALTIRLPITVKDLAAEMKLKVSQLVQKLFLQNIIFTLNDYLEDETMVQYLGQEFGCEIVIDTSEEDRIQITNRSIAEEIAQTDANQLQIRPPVVAFMGHVDHGKTSLIDTIRKSNIAKGEAGSITQHIGAFMCHTAVGDLTVLDTPGHEAFSAMRARGAEVTDIVVLVVAGDEGLKEQTREAIQHAKAAGVTIVVAVNKCDKPNFNVEQVYRELAEVELLPEAWGGQTITVNTSAVTGEGISSLLEMLALQAEILELMANPQSRARGTVLESELHKGMGCVATILVQNGTLHQGDAVVFERHYGRIKTMEDEFGHKLETAGPSHPVKITGLSGLPAAGDPFIVVKHEKEAKHIVDQREVGLAERQLRLRKAPNLDNLLEQKAEKKVLNILIRGDVQGSVEALKTSIMKIESDKAEPNIIFTGVGEVSESDVQLAAASHAIIVGFHTGIEPNAADLIKEQGVMVKQHDIIYHAIDDIKRLMAGLLDKIEEENDIGTAEVKAVFKSSHVGNIAGCLVTSGLIQRSNKIRLVRGGQIIWKGSIGSLKREKEDVKEVKKGLECGIVLQGFEGVQVDDQLQSYELTYREQEL